MTPARKLRLPPAPVAFRAAVVAALTLAFASVTLADESLGRLFLTPDQRLALEARRAPDAADGSTAGNEAPHQPTAARQVLLNGVVQRRDGTSVVWMNGQEIGPDRQQAVQVRRGPGHQARVTLTAPDGNTIRLKPGQAWDPATGRVTECLGCESEAGKHDAIAAAPVQGH